MDNYNTKNLNYPSPCPHCGKKNENKWCYEYTSESGSLYGVCKREAEPAQGWELTDYADKDGTSKYRMIRERFVKQVRTKAERSWTYHDLSGKELVLVKRVDNGDGEKARFSQWHYSDRGELIKGLKPLDRADIPVYSFGSVRKAIDLGDRIWIVEGESCADALTRLFENTANVATTNLGGSGKWLDSDTECLRGAKRVVICPDRDKPGKKHAEKVADQLRRAAIPFSWCFPDPSNWEWQDLPDSQGFDVADWLKEKTNNLDGLIGSIVDRPVWEKEPEIKPAVNLPLSPIRLSVDLEDSEPLTRLDTRKLYQYVKATFGKRLRFNELTKEVELDGEDLDLTYAYLDLAIDHGLKVNKDIAIDIFLRASKDNSYHPVRDYLEKVAGLYPGDFSLIDDIATRYFGTKNPLYDLFMKNTLIGAVARIFKPGCDMQNALVLQGKPGVRKSTFFKVLTGDDWFNDDFKDGSNADNLMVLHSHWIIEWGEIEKVLGKSKACDLKPFITCTKDNFREPYARRSHPVKRQQILVGSTNESEFLQDPTGNRRYWVIPVAVDQIDIDLLRQERNQLWAAAVNAYMAGEQWHLTPEQEKMAAENNEQFTCSDVWDDEIIGYIKDKEQVTIADILKNAIGVETALQTKSAEWRVSSFLRKSGWFRALNGKSRQRIWINPNNSTDEQVIQPPIQPPEIEVDHPLITGYDHPENLHGERVLEKGDPGDPTNQLFLEKNSTQDFSSTEPEKNDRNLTGDRLEVGDQVEYFHELYGIKQVEIVGYQEGIVNETGEPWLLYRLSDGSAESHHKVTFLGKKHKWYAKNGQRKT